ncbi:MAG TPA: BadF/BadG/BcrA/BcrD ATPase family protein [Isosphaeraceae bacterium]|jgi:N-acetylglucosamine kinase-like BadF-type ATPase|nr:BadF/BadG/BcrA/BcrD ATPase family protein [Isosphaeraceae bacterium]
MSPLALLGIDGGGTTTTAWLADEAGTVRARGCGGPSNIKAVGPEAALRALGEAIAQAFAEAGSAPHPVEVACLGLAGFDRPEDKELLGGWAEQGRWARRLVLVNDGDLVVAAGTAQGWGVGVISGTGSIAVGRSRDGRTTRAGGWGHLIGDEGSGYAVALAALRHVARRADGRERHPSSRDLLTECLCEAMGITGPAQLVSRLYDPDFDRPRVAALAPVVVAAARDDPEIEVEILEPAGRDLGEMVVAVAHALGWDEADDVAELPLALAGGFLLSAPSVSGALLRALEDEGYPAVAMEVPQPVRGAILLARKAMHE